MRRILSSRSTIIRTALVAALLVLAAILGWVALTKLSSGLVIVALVLVPAILPLAATALLRRRHNALGATVAIFAGLVGAFVGFALTVCVLCTVRPPLSIEAVALLVVAGFVLALTVLDVIAQSPPIAS